MSWWLWWWWCWSWWSWWWSWWWWWWWRRRRKCCFATNCYKIQTWPTGACLLNTNKVALWNDDDEDTSDADADDVDDGYDVDDDVDDDAAEEYLCMLCHLQRSTHNMFEPCIRVMGMMIIMMMMMMMVIISSTMMIMKSVMVQALKVSAFEDSPV